MKCHFAINYEATFVRLIILPTRARLKPRIVATKSVLINPLLHDQILVDKFHVSNAFWPCINWEVLTTLYYK